MTFKCVTRMMGGWVDTWQRYEPLSLRRVGLTRNRQLLGRSKATE